MNKVLVFLKLGGRSARRRQGKFIFNQEHNVHLFEGRELSIEEFNNEQINLLPIEAQELLDAPVQVKIIEKKVEIAKPISSVVEKVAKKTTKTATKTKKKLFGGNK